MSPVTMIDRTVSKDAPSKHGILNDPADESNSYCDKILAWRREKMVNVV